MKYVLYYLLIDRSRGPPRTNHRRFWGIELPPAFYIYSYIILGEDVIQILLAVGEYAIPICCLAADAVRYGPMRSDVVHCGPAPMR